MKDQRATISLVSLGLLLCMPAPAPGQTDVSGPITTDTVWTLEGSPYIVVASIVILNGATLTIEPGVQVRFELDIALVVDDGTLVARGSETSPIVFTANQGPTNRWGYLQFSANAVDATFDVGDNYLSGCILEHTVVEYAGSTGHQAVRAINTRPYVRASTVRQSAAGGMYISGGGASSTRLEGNTFHNIPDAGAWGGYEAGPVYVVGAPSVKLVGNVVTQSGFFFGSVVSIINSPSCTLTGNLISNNSSGGVELNDPSTYCVLDGNTISNNAGYNGGGVYIGARYTTLTGNTILGNSARIGGGVNLYGAAFSTVSGNAILNNSASHFGGGISLNRYTYSCNLENNVIAGNTAGIHGGAIHGNEAYNITLSGDYIVGNHCLGGGAGGVYLTYNDFYPYGWKFSGASGPDVGAVPPFVHIYGNDNYQLWNNMPFGGSFECDGSRNVDARYVYWGTRDEAEIQAGIYDFFDDGARGFVCYAPYLVLGDIDGNGHVDLLDFELFLDCITGPGGGPAEPGCEFAHFDADDDIDLVDFAGFQRAFTGSEP